MLPSCFRYSDYNRSAWVCKSSQKEKRLPFPAAALVGSALNLFYAAFFLSADSGCYRRCAAADKQQGKPQGEAEFIILRPVNLVRAAYGNGGDCLFIGIKSADCAALPILSVAALPAVLMLAAITALGADAVFPLVAFLDYRSGSAAFVCLGIYTFFLYHVLIKAFKRVKSLLHKFLLQIPVSQFQKTIIFLYNVQDITVIMS